MGNVFLKAPNVIRIVITEVSPVGKTEERYITGLTMDEVVEAVTLSTDGAEHSLGVYDKPKKRRKRRTREQIESDEKKDHVSTGEKKPSDV